MTNAEAWNKLLDLVAAVRETISTGGEVNYRASGYGLRDLRRMADELALLEPQEVVRGTSDGKKPLCRGCGFTAGPEEFEAALSPYHDLRCPKCKTTNIEWDCGGYKGNTLDSSGR